MLPPIRFAEKLSFIQALVLTRLFGVLLDVAVARLHGGRGFMQLLFQQHDDEIAPKEAKKHEDTSHKHSFSSVRITCSVLLTIPFNY